MLRRKRTKWITLFRLQRELYGAYYIMPQLDDVEFRKFLRVTSDEFKEIHSFT